MGEPSIIKRFRGGGGLLKPPPHPTGNTAVVLLLPPAEAALGALLLAEMATAGGGVLREGGAPLPPGALNVVCGAPPLPRALRSHPSVRHVVALGDGQVTPPPPPQNNPNPPTPPTKFHLCPHIGPPPRVALYCTPVTPYCPL